MKEAPLYDVTGQKPKNKDKEDLRIAVEEAPLLYDVDSDTPIMLANDETTPLQSTSTKNERYERQN